MSCKFMVLLAAVALEGCFGASVSTLKAADPVDERSCQVTVHSSLEEAKARGAIEELCIITGTSSGSFSHTVATAIEKHKDKACGCGARDVYIQAQAPADMTVASVTLVAFRYVGPESAKPAAKGDHKQEIERAKKCQAKGGVYLDGKCEIQLD